MDDHGFVPLHVIAGIKKVNYFLDVPSCMLAWFTFLTESYLLFSSL